MDVDGKAYRTIWVDGQDELTVINQLALPHRFETVQLNSLDRVCWAIKEMVVRGAVDLLPVLPEPPALGLKLGAPF